MDTFIDIFNVLSAVASRYVDSVGTFVRKLNLSEAPTRARELLGEHDPIFVFVYSEIEEAICSMAGDLSAVRQRYPSSRGIDWLSFQYHLTLLQKDGPTGWDAPGFRLGGRIPMSVADICQNVMTHDHFTHCHSTPFRDWQRVRHMNTLESMISLLYSWNFFQFLANFWPNSEVGPESIFCQVCNCVPDL